MHASHVSNTIFSLNHMRNHHSPAQACLGSVRFSIVWISSKFTWIFPKTFPYISERVCIYPYRFPDEIILIPGCLVAFALDSGDREEAYFLLLHPNAFAWIQNIVWLLWLIIMFRITSMRRLWGCSCSFYCQYPHETCIVQKHTHIYTDSIKRIGNEIFRIHERCTFIVNINCLDN